MFHAVFGWFLHVTGSDNTSGTWYGFWSGFGSDLGEVAILGGMYRMLNCHTDGCKKIGLHHVPGTNFKVCRSHHPTGGNSHFHILNEHRKAMEENARRR